MSKHLSGIIVLHTDLCFAAVINRAGEQDGDTCLNKAFGSSKVGRERKEMVRAHPRAQNIVEHIPRPWEHRMGGITTLSSARLSATLLPVAGLALN